MERGGMMRIFFLATGLWFMLHGSVFCLAEEFQLEVREDSYGGSLYRYLDQNGNQCMTNSTDYLPMIVFANQKDRHADNNETRTQTVTLVLAKNNETTVSPGKEETDDYLEEYEEGKATESIADPLEPMNRFFFQFNDKLYFYLLKPVASGYKKVLPTPVRTSIGNFFENIIYPVRFVSCLLQGKIDGVFVETGRFVANSTLGLAGLFDPATELFEMKKYDEDLGQAFGSWGLGFGFFLELPFFGPSSLRDGIGKVGDYYLDPIYYLCPDFWDKAAFRVTDVINYTSFRIGDYEDLKKASLDPYVAIRDAYVQYRVKKVAD